MRRRLGRPSLRRTLVSGAVIIVLASTATSLVSLYLTVSTRAAIDRDSNAFIDEQRIADRIVSLTYQQQLEAYRYLERPGETHRVVFDAKGDSAALQMRRYLFRELSPAARLQIEKMKETHQIFEVTAHRAIDLAQQGETAAAHARVASLAEQAVALDSAVKAFLHARIAQREAVQAQYRDRTARVRAALVLIGVALVALAAVVARQLQRRVIAPLDQLIAAAQRISGGDADARMPTQTDAELSHVASAFNEMADAVQVARETTELQNEELRQSIDQLQQTQEELVQHEKLSAMGQMLAGVAHELNNPLAGVLGMAELLRDELSASRDGAMHTLATELAAPLASEAGRARDLVRNLLSFARKPSGTLGAVALSTAVRIAIGLRSSAYAQAGRMLTMDVPASLYVEAETQKLQLVIVNLVNNALDAMTADHGTVLRISAFVDDDDSVALRFEDDGPGFTDPSSAFEAFYTTKPAGRGTGLGLSLTQKFVDEFGGSVSADNRAEGGARVTIVLRRAPSPAEDAAATAAPASRVSGPTPGALAGDVPAAASRGAQRQGRPRVLVVDDEASLREVQRRLLLLEDIDVLLASSGEEALDILSVERVDLVVSDLRMPGKTDGRGLLTWLEQHQPALSEHVLIVTGDVSGLPSDTAQGIPAERVLRKPFSREEYISRVRAALGPTGSHDV